MVEKESEKIHSLSYACIIFTAFLSVFIAKGNYVLFSLTKNDTWIAAIFGFILSFTFFYIIRYIVNKNEKNDIFELNETIFGKVFGNILNISLCVGFFLVSIIILYNMADFFNTEYLPETSVEYLKILVLLPLIYISTKNLSSIIKMNQIFSIVSLVFIIFSFLGIFGELQIENIEPILMSSKKDIIKSVFTYFLLSNIPLSILLVASRKNISDSNRLNGNLTKSFIFTNIVLVAIILVTILTLGSEYLNIFRFPEYITLKQFSLFNLLERIENILALQYYFNCVGLLSFLYYFIIKLFPNTRFKRYYSIIIAACQFLITKIIFKNTITFIEVIKGNFIYIVVAFITIPVLITFFRLITEKNKSLHNIAK